MLRAQIEQLRDSQPHRASLVPARRRATEARYGIATGCCSIRTSACVENAPLKDELAIAHGKHAARPGWPDRD